MFPPATETDVAHTSCCNPRRLHLLQPAAADHDVHTCCSIQPRRRPLLLQPTTSPPATNAVPEIRDEKHGIRAYFMPESAILPATEAELQLDRKLGRIHPSDELPICSRQSG
jgi:hypothetical protein